MNDGGVLYVVVAMTPLKEDTLLIPQFIDTEDPASELGIEEVTDGTVSDYASSSGKTVVYSDASLEFNGTYLDATVDFHLSGDGTLYEWLTASSPQAEGTVTLTCVGSAYAPDASVAEHAYGEIRIQNKSDTRTLNCKLADTSSLSSDGISVSTITAQESDLGLYFTINWSG